ncbi:MAG: universal stress protein [Solirubrobacteraceae bacterium]
MRSRAQRLLVGVDGSQAAASALRHAVRLARRNHGLLVVACVVPDHTPSVVSSPFGMCSASGEDPRAVAAEVLRAARSRVPDTVSIVTVIQPGRVGPVLAQMADRFGCDTIVIGAHHGLWSRVSGGVERYLRRHAEARLIVDHDRRARARARAPRSGARAQAGAGARARPA